MIDSVSGRVAPAPVPRFSALKDARLSATALAAHEDANAIIAKLQDGTKRVAELRQAGIDARKGIADAQKAARLDQTATKLKMLKIDAIFSVAMHDPKAALRVAREAAKVARGMRDMRDAVDPTQDAAVTRESLPLAAADVSGPDRRDIDPDGPSPQPTPVSAQPAAGLGQSATFDGTVDEMIQLARKVIAIARKAVAPGGPEDHEMATLQGATGISGTAVDTVTDADLKIADDERSTMVNVAV